MNSEVRKISRRGEMPENKGRELVRTDVADPVREGE